MTASRYERAGGIWQLPGLNQGHRGLVYARGCALASRSRMSGLSVHILAASVGIVPLALQDKHLARYTPPPQMPLRRTAGLAASLTGSGQQTPGCRPIHIIHESCPLKTASPLPLPRCHQRVWTRMSNA